MENQAEQKDKLNHVAVILDGNRRFAKNKGHMLWKGHDSGAETFENFLKWCKELEIKEVTAYILSTENLKREPEELNHLFNLFKKWFEKFAPVADVIQSGVAELPMLTSIKNVIKKAEGRE